MSQRITYTIVVCYDFAKEWLDKSRAERKAFETAHVAPILMKYEGRLRRRAFDAAGRPWRIQQQRPGRPRGQ